MAGYSVEEVLKNGTAVVLGASQSKAAVSNNFKISAADSLHLLVKFTAGTFTLGGGITAKIQDAADGATFADTDGTVAITGNGTFEMDVNVSNATDSPLWATGRVVVTTGAGSAVTISSVKVSRRL